MMRAARVLSVEADTANTLTQSALMARVVASMFVTCIRASHPGAATTLITRRTP